MVPAGENFWASVTAWADWYDEITSFISEASATGGGSCAEIPASSGQATCVGAVLLSMAWPALGAVPSPCGLHLRARFPPLPADWFGGGGTQSLDLRGQTGSTAR